MSKSSTPRELLSRYLQAVRFWLPRSRTQEDLLAELGEDLRSQIEEKETELGRPLDEKEVSDVLKRCGSPMLVAARLGPKGYLIGPTLFPIYTFVLKMVLLWILVPVFLFIVGPVNVASAGGRWGDAWANTLGDLWSGLFVAAGIITLVFAVLERTHAPSWSSKWDPLKLPPLQRPERRTSLVQTVCDMAFSYFGLIWLLLLPHYPILILGPAKAFLKLSPFWHSFYVPILLLTLVALLRSTITLVRPQWDWFPLSAQLVQTAFTLILLNFMIHVAGQTHNAGWHPFVILADSARNSLQYARVVAIVNVSILLGLISAWLAMCIAALVQCWQLMRYLRRRNPGAQQPAHST